MSFFCYFSTLRLAGSPRDGGRPGGVGGGGGPGSHGGSGGGGPTKGGRGRGCVANSQGRGSGSPHPSDPDIGPNKSTEVHGAFITPLSLSNLAPSYNSH